MDIKRLSNRLQQDGWAIVPGNFEGVICDLIATKKVQIEWRIVVKTFPLLDLRTAQVWLANLQRVKEKSCRSRGFKPGHPLIFCLLAGAVSPELSARTQEGFWSSLTQHDPLEAAKVFFLVDEHSHTIFVSHDLPDNWRDVHTLVRTVQQAFADVLDGAVPITPAPAGATQPAQGRVTVAEVSRPTVKSGIPNLGLDYLSLLVAGLVSFGLRFVISAGLGGFHGDFKAEARAITVAGIIASFVGGLIAGLLKRRDPKLGSGIAEGSAIGVFHAIVSNRLCGAGPLFTYSLSFLGWFLFIFAGSVGGGLGSLRIQPRPKPGSRGAITGSAETIPALIQALHDPISERRAEAADALGEIGPDAYEAVPALIELLRDPGARFEAADALGCIGQRARDAVPPLIALLADTDSRLRLVAAASLTDITGQDFGENAAAWQAWWETQP